jgi:hypothetical protein
MEKCAWPACTSSIDTDRLFPYLQPGMHIGCASRCARDHVVCTAGPNLQEDHVQPVPSVEEQEAPSKPEEGRKATGWLSL